MGFKDYRIVYFLGIGGIGMSALARYFKSQGKSIYGYDKTATSLTDELESEGMKIHFTDDLNLIPLEEFKVIGKDLILVIYTPAIPSDNSELKYFNENHYIVKKRSEVLGEITKNQFTIAVAGTHGKTTTSSIIAHILKDSGADCTAFLGGICKNYNSNFLSSNKSNAPIVVEADEYDKSFLTLHPDIAVITSMDADHLDIYGDKLQLEKNYEKFSKQIKTTGKLFIKTGLGSMKNSYSYSICNDADFTVTNINIINHNYVFDLDGIYGKIVGISLGLPGIHNVENALVAAAIAQYLRIDNNAIKRALNSFNGVKRRFDIRFKSSQTIYIDDYAHHPEELRSCIQSVKDLYPGKKITGIFQPHLFTRTRDFVDGFSESLSMLDELILMDIYPARELPIAGITSNIVLDKVTIKNKRILGVKEILSEVENKDHEIILTLGAGDIDKLINPIEEILNNRYKQ
ncbi:MAG: UDP-N-acetylmuramate--L-alanine ligase [Bacteroidota bacterium]